MPSFSHHEHRVPMPDGVTLRVQELVPRHASGLRVLVGHAMMVDARTLYRPDRPSLVGSLLRAGLHCFVVDARGRAAPAASGIAPADFGYDTHVQDVGSLLAWLRALGAGPIALLGHSLFAHTSLAHLARHPHVLCDQTSPLFAHVGLGCNLWLPSCDASATRRALKRAAMLAGDLSVCAAGRMPARRLRVGTADEPAPYWRDFRRFWRSDRWASADGFDYRAGLRDVRLPSLCVVSDGDRWMSRPADALHFTAPLPQRQVWHLGPVQRRKALLGLCPDHMGMLVDPRSEPLWEQVGAWLGALR